MKIGDKISVKINKIKNNGCNCSIYPYGRSGFGFLPNYLMPSLFDKNGKFVKSVGDLMTVVVSKINDKGFITFSDIETYEKEQEKLRKKAIKKQNIEDFTSEYEIGTIFEAEVIQIKESKIVVKVGEVQGIIKKEDTNWNEIDRLEDVLYEGEVINAVYIKNESGKLFFSLKLLNEKPYDEKLYDLSSSDLLKYAGHESNVFVGQAKQSGNFAFIENLYSCDENQKGKLLVDPVFGYNLKALAINQFENQITDGEYYKVKLSGLVDKKKRLERNQLFQFTAEIINKTDNPYKKDVDLAFKKLTSPAGNVAIAHLLKEVVGNMLAAKDRMFFELVQNADDAASESGVRIKVKTEGDFLVVSHNGVSFDKDDFDAIVSAANGTKKSDENKTGYKGIGFKTVFKEANRVFIKTGGYQFKFDKSDVRFTDFDSFYFLVNGLRTKEQQQAFLANCAGERNKFKGVEDIPWQLEPIWVDVFPEKLGQNFAKSNVAIALEIGEQKILGKDGYCQAIEEIITNPKFMLFLRNTNRIDFNDKSVSKSVKDGEITLKNSFNESRLQHYKLLDYNVKINALEERNLGFRQNIIEQNDEGRILDANFIDDTNQVIDNIPSKIALNESTTISFAIPIGQNGTFEPNENEAEISIFAFLPTLVKEFDFSVFVNANFLLTPDRQHILGDNPWNYFLMEELADKLVELAANLCLKKDYNALNVLKPKCFEYQTPDVKQLAEHFNSAYKSALESEAFILNHKGDLSRIDKIALDIPGLSKLVGEDLFCKFMRTNKKLPSASIDCSILRKGLFDKLVDKYDLNDVLERITDNSEFNGWFVASSEDQKETFYRWINWIKDKNYEPSEGCLKHLVCHLPLFQFEEEYKSCKEISSSDNIVTTEQIIPIKGILSKLGFVCSDNVFDESHPLYVFVELQDEDDLFNSIKDCDFSDLTADERKSLFFALADFDGVGEAKLKDIALFHNLNGDAKPLGEMVAYRDNVPQWLSEYVLCEEDNDSELSDYLISQKDEFKSIIQEHIGEIDTPITELYKTYKNEWTGQCTRQIIDEYEIDNEILTIIEESDTKTKEYFLNSFQKLELHSTSTYKKDSYEYRVLQLVLSVYDEPSDFSSKIYFDGQCIKDFSISDDVVCDFYQDGETKKVKLSLAKLLPQYQNQSDSIYKIKALFENKKDLDKFFETESKSVYEVHKELNQYLSIPESYYPVWNVNGNVQQFLFATYYRRQKKGWNNLYVPKIDLNKETDEFVYELLDFLFDNGISVEESPFTYHLKKCFIGKYFDSDYVFDGERLLPTIEKWADDEKKIKYLKDNSVQTSDCIAIQFRKLFLEDKPIDFTDKLEGEEIESGIEFFATAEGFKRPFVGKNQKNVLLALKNKCKDLTCNWDDKKMEEKSREWDSKEYKEWIEDHYPKVFIYPGMLPSQLSYNDELLLNYEDSENDYYFNSQEKKLYVSNTRKIEEILLFEVVKDGKCGFGLNDYKFLCSDGKVSLTQEEKDDYDNLKDEKEKIKSALQKRGLNYDDLLKGDEIDEDKEGFDGPIIKKASMSPLGDERKIDAQIEAQRKLQEMFPNWEYPDGFGKGGVYSTFEVIKGNNIVISVVLKSHKASDEPLKINPNEWDYLMDGAKLFIYTGSDIKELEPKYLIEKQPKIALSFCTENLDIEERITAFSDSLHYFKELSFDFESFNLSEKAKSIEGIYNKNEGFQNSTSDNDL